MARPEPFQHGLWTASYELRGNLERRHLEDLQQMLLTTQGRYTGWPVWWVSLGTDAPPYAMDGNLECWLGGDDAAHADFWRASPEGRMFLVRGFQEDTKDSGLEPGRFLDQTLPIWRIGECLLHAQSLAATFADESATVRFSATWEGLTGRALTNWVNKRRDVRARVARQDKVEVAVRVDDASSIASVLPELVTEVTRPLYEAFGLFRMPDFVVREELAALQREKF